MVRKRSCVTHVARPTERVRRLIEYSLEKVLVSIKHSTVASIWYGIRSRPLAWDTITTTGWSTLGRGVGFLVPFFIAAWFGVSSQTDAFFFSYGVILFLATIFAPVIQSIIVPYISEARSKNEDVREFVGKVFAISGVGLLILAGLFLILAKPALSTITKFTEPSLTLVWIILVETSPLVVLIVWTSILAGALNAYKKFALPAVVPAFRAVVNLTVIFALKGVLGVHAIAWGYVVGEVVRLLILLITVRRLRLFPLKLSLGLNSRTREFLRSISYQLVGMVAVGLNQVIDKTMASWLGEGSVSVLYYADRLYMIPVTFLSAGLLVTILSHWSGEYYETSNIEKLKKNVKKASRLVGFVSLIITVVLLILSAFIVHLVYGHGEFPKDKIDLLRWTWLCYLAGFIPHALTQIVVRGHLVLKNTHFLMINALILNCCNAILNLALMRILGTKGIALATSVVTLISLIFLWILLAREFGTKMRSHLES